MMPLPTGVTGFNVEEQGVDFDLFIQTCREAVSTLKGQVHETDEAYSDVTPNFHGAVVSFPDRPERIRIICNAHHPIIAFCQPPTDPMDIELRFMDCPQLARLLCQRFTVLSAAEAEAGVSSELVARLNDAELHQMRYWKPARIGDVIFNPWD